MIGSPILIDTTIFMLLVAGLTNRNIITAHKNISNRFTAEDQGHRVKVFSALIVSRMRQHPVSNHEGSSPVFDTPPAAAAQNEGLNGFHPIALG